MIIRIHPAEITGSNPAYVSSEKYIETLNPTKNIKVIPHGIEPTAFYKSDHINRTITRKMLNIKPDEFLLTNVSALTRNKGIDLLLAAYILLKPKYINLRLLIKDSSNLYGRKLKNVVDGMTQDKRFKNLDFSKLNDGSIIIVLSSNSISHLLLLK